MKTLFLAILCFALPAASVLPAADEPLIPAPLNEALGRIKPGMTETDAKAQFATTYPKVQVTLGDWSGTTGYIDFRLDERYSVSLAAHNPQNGGSAVLDKNLLTYIFDHQRKQQLEITHYQWDVPSAVK